MLMVEIGSWTRDLCLGDPISLPLHHEVTLIELFKMAENHWSKYMEKSSNIKKLKGHRIINMEWRFHQKSRKHPTISHKKLSDFLTISMPLIKPHKLTEN
jgi:hypothetical protein